MSPSRYRQYLDAINAGVIVLTSLGEIQFVNAQARRYFTHHIADFDSSLQLADLVENSSASIHVILRSWSRSRTPLPARLAWKSNGVSSGLIWRCHGHMIERASEDKAAVLMIVCRQIRDQLSVFNTLNQELAKTAMALKKLQRTRDELEKQRELAAVTLNSIGDAVITTNLAGEIEFLNPVAEDLTGWSLTAAAGLPSPIVFNIINEGTGEPVPDPVMEAITSNRILELSNHTILISRLGREIVIEDSVAPIRDSRGKILGAVLVFHDVTDSRLMRKQLEYTAQHDMLTSLKNRHFFQHEVDKAIELARRGRIKAGFLYIDLDEFKAVNDTAGHAIGDNLLVQVAELFLSRARRGDILARLGGDEFGVLLQNIDPSEMDEIAISYQSALNKFSFTWDEKVLKIEASIGTTVIDQFSGTTAEAFRQVDVACYIAKQRGKNRYHHYSAEDDTQSQQLTEMDMINRIHHALEHNGFVLHLQKILVAKDESLRYYECLIRMKNGGELLYPGAFIPFAERHSVMSKIDKWVIKSAFDLLENASDTNMRLSINLSGLSINEAEVVNYLSQRLDSHPALAAALTIEITETAAVSNIEKAAEFVHRFKRYGVRFALDDFGTGFSSFAYLKHLPVDYVKIDGVFVRDIAVDASDMAMVRAINTIAHSLGKQTIAEFVESEEIYNILVGMGVDCFQGYHIARPVDASELL